MSKDNGIYILKTKDGQYRVALLSAIENAYWSYLNGSQDLLVPSRVLEMWGDKKFTKSHSKAVEIATKWYEHEACEYGIITIQSDQVWKEIVEEGTELSIRELCELQKDEKHVWITEDLIKAASGIYLKEWNTYERHLAENKSCIDFLHKKMRRRDFFLEVDDITLLGITDGFYTYSQIKENGDGFAMHYHSLFKDLKEELIHIKGEAWYDFTVRELYDKW